LKVIIDFGEQNYNTKIRKYVYRKFLSDRQLVEEVRAKEDKLLKGIESKSLEELMNEKERVK